MEPIKLSPPSGLRATPAAEIDHVFRKASGALDFLYIVEAPVAEAPAAAALPAWAPYLVRALERGHFTRTNWSALEPAALADLRERHSVTVDYVQGGEARMTDEAAPDIPRVLWVAAARAHPGGAAAHLVVSPRREWLEAVLARSHYADLLDFDLTPAERSRFAREVLNRAKDEEAEEREREREFTEESRTDASGTRNVKFVAGEADSAERLRREQMRGAAEARANDWQREAKPRDGETPAARQERLRREELAAAAKRAAELKQNEHRAGRAEFVEYAGRPEDMRSRTGEAKSRVERAQYRSVADMRAADDAWGQANSSNVSKWHADRMAANARKHSPSALARAQRDRK